MGTVVPSKAVRGGIIMNTNVSFTMRILLCRARAKLLLSPDGEKVFAFLVGIVRRQLHVVQQTDHQHKLRLLGVVQDDVWWGPSLMTTQDLQISLIPDLQPCVFGGPSLNRLNNHRHKSETPAKIAHPNARHIIFNSQLQVLICSNNGSTSLALLPAANCSQFHASTEDPLLLGVDAESIPYVALRLHDFGHDHTALFPSDAQFVHLRSVFSRISGVHAAIAAHARSLFVFHQRHKFCGQCGAQTVSDQAGARRRCIRNVSAVEPSERGFADQNQCDGVWFPRTDPVVIMLVLDSSGERTLLGRQSRFPQGMYSCLAGFMEHGEGIEDAVRREVFEEAGVHVGRVRFFTSQPWPFPYSLMLGCVARADSEQISIDPHELEDARWFSRDEVVTMMANKESGGRHNITNSSDDTNKHSKLFVPPTAAIAGKLLEIFALREPITMFDHKTSGML